MARSWSFGVVVCIILFTTAFSQAQGEDQSKAVELQQNNGNPLQLTPLPNTPPKVQYSEGVIPRFGVGEALYKRGISPIINALQFNFYNPSMGLKPGYMSAYTIVTVGADLDMQKIVGYRSATIHFQQELLPFGHNLSYGNQTGDSIVGTNIYAPKTSYLGQFTWEQKAFDNRLELEGGKANAFTHFAFPNCIQLIICQSPILQRDAGINPPTLFSNWFARAAYKVGVELIASEFSGAGIQ